MSPALKTALIDASSAILLFKADLLDPLLDNYNLVMVPTVYREITPTGYAGAGTFCRAYQRGRFRLVPQSRSEEQPPHREAWPAALNRGERETIHCFQAGCGDFIIIDDGRGAAYCRASGIPYINALLFPRILYFSRRITKEVSEASMARLRAKGRYAAWVVDFARRASAEELAGFLCPSL